MPPLRLKLDDFILGGSEWFEDTLDEYVGDNALASTYELRFLYKGEPVLLEDLEVEVFNIEVDEV